MKVPKEQNSPGNCITVVGKIFDGKRDIALVIMEIVFAHSQLQYAVDIEFRCSMRRVCGKPLSEALLPEMECLPVHPNDDS